MFQLLFVTTTITIICSSRLLLLLLNDRRSNSTKKSIIISIVLLLLLFTWNNVKKHNNYNNCMTSSSNKQSLMLSSHCDDCSFSSITYDADSSSNILFRNMLIVHALIPYYHSYSSSRKTTNIIHYDNNLNDNNNNNNNNIPTSSRYYLSSMLYKPHHNIHWNNNNNNKKMILYLIPKKKNDIFDNNGRKKHTTITNNMNYNIDRFNNNINNQRTFSLSSNINNQKNKLLLNKQQQQEDNDREPIIIVPILLTILRSIIINTNTNNYDLYPFISKNDNMNNNNNSNKPDYKNINNKISNDNNNRNSTSSNRKSNMMKNINDNDKLSLWNQWSQFQLLPSPILTTHDSSITKEDRKITSTTTNNTANNRINNNKKRQETYSSMNDQFNIISSSIISLYNDIQQQQQQATTTVNNWLMNTFESNISITTIIGSIILNIFITILLSNQFNTYHYFSFNNMMIIPITSLIAGYISTKKGYDGGLIRILGNITWTIITISIKIINQFNIALNDAIDVSQQNQQSMMNDYYNNMIMMTTNDDDDESSIIADTNNNNGNNNVPINIPNFINNYDEFWNVSMTASITISNSINSMIKMIDHMNQIYENNIILWNNRRQMNQLILSSSALLQSSLAQQQKQEEIHTDNINNVTIIRKPTLEDVEILSSRNTNDSNTTSVSLLDDITKINEAYDRLAQLTAVNPILVNNVSRSSSSSSITEYDDDDDDDTLTTTAVNVTTSSIILTNHTDSTTSLFENISMKATVDNNQHHPFHEYHGMAFNTYHTHSDSINIRNVMKENVTHHRRNNSENINNNHYQNNSYVNSNNGRIDEVDYNNIIVNDPMNLKHLINVDDSSNHSTIITTTIIPSINSSLVVVDPIEDDVVVVDTTKLNVTDHHLLLDNKHNHDKVSTVEYDEIKLNTISINNSSLVVMDPIEDVTVLDTTTTLNETDHIMLLDSKGIHHDDNVSIVEDGETILKKVKIKSKTPIDLNFVITHRKKNNKVETPKKKIEMIDNIFRPISSSSYVIKSNDASTSMDDGDIKTVDDVLESSSNGFVTQDVEDDDTTSTSAIVPLETNVTNCIDEEEEMKSNDDDDRFLSLVGNDVSNLTDMSSSQMDNSSSNAKDILRDDLIVSSIPSQIVASSNETNHGRYETRYDDDTNSSIVQDQRTLIYNNISLHGTQNSTRIMANWNEITETLTSRITLVMQDFKTRLISWITYAQNEIVAIANVFSLSEDSVDDDSIISSNTISENVVQENNTNLTNHHPKWDDSITDDDDFSEGIVLNSNDTGMSVTILIKNTKNNDENQIPLQKPVESYVNISVVEHIANISLHESENNETSLDTHIVHPTNDIDLITDTDDTKEEMNGIHHIIQSKFGFIDSQIILKDQQQQHLIDENNTTDSLDVICKNDQVDTHSILNKSENVHNIPILNHKEENSNEASSFTTADGINELNQLEQVPLILTNEEEKLNTTNMLVAQNMTIPDDETKITNMGLIGFTRKADIVNKKKSSSIRAFKPFVTDVRNILMSTIDIDNEASLKMQLFRNHPFQVNNGIAFNTYCNDNQENMSTNSNRKSRNNKNRSRSNVDINDTQTNVKNDSIKANILNDKVDMPLTLNESKTHPAPLLNNNVNETESYTTTDNTSAQLNHQDDIPPLLLPNERSTQQIGTSKPSQNFSWVSDDSKSTIENSNAVKATETPQIEIHNGAKSDTVDKDTGDDNVTRTAALKPNAWSTLPKKIRGVLNVTGVDRNDKILQDVIRPTTKSANVDMISLADVEFQQKLQDIRNANRNVMLVKTKTSGIMKGDRAEIVNKTVSAPKINIALSSSNKEDSDNVSAFLSKNISSHSKVNVTICETNSNNVLAIRKSPQSFPVPKELAMEPLSYIQVDTNVSNSFLASNNSRVARPIDSNRYVAEANVPSRNLTFIKFENISDGLSDQQTVDDHILSNVGGHLSNNNPSLEPDIHTKLIKLKQQLGRMYVKVRNDTIVDKRFNGTTVFHNVTSERGVTTLRDNNNLRNSRRNQLLVPEVEDSNKDPKIGVTKSVLRLFQPFESSYAVVTTANETKNARYSVAAKRLTIKTHLDGIFDKAIAKDAIKYSRNPRRRTSNLINWINLCNTSQLITNYYMQNSTEQIGHEQQMPFNRFNDARLDIQNATKVKEPELVLLNHEELIIYHKKIDVQYIGKTKLVANFRTEKLKPIVDTRTVLRERSHGKQNQVPMNGIKLNTNNITTKNMFDIGNALCKIYTKYSNRNSQNESAEQKTITGRVDILASKSNNEMDFIPTCNSNKNNVTDKTMVESKLSHIEQEGQDHSSNNGNVVEVVIPMENHLSIFGDYGLPRIEDSPLDMIDTSLFIFNANSAKTYMTDDAGGDIAMHRADSISDNATSIPSSNLDYSMSSTDLALSGSKIPHTRSSANTLFVLRTNFENLKSGVVDAFISVREKLHRHYSAHERPKVIKGMSSNLASHNPTKKTIQIIKRKNGKRKSRRVVLPTVIFSRQRKGLKAVRQGYYLKLNTQDTNTRKTINVVNTNWREGRRGVGALPIVNSKQDSVHERPKVIIGTSSNFTSHNPTWKTIKIIKRKKGKSKPRKVILPNVIFSRNRKGLKAGRQGYYMRLKAQDKKSRTEILIKKTNSGYFMSTQSKSTTSTKPSQSRINQPMTSSIRMSDVRQKTVVQSGRQGYFLKLNRKKAQTPRTRITIPRYDTHQHGTSSLSKLNLFQHHDLEYDVVGETVIQESNRGLEAIKTNDHDILNVGTGTPMTSSDEEQGMAVLRDILFELVSTEQLRRASRTVVERLAIILLCMCLE